MNCRSLSGTRSAPRRGCVGRCLDRRETPSPRSCSASAHKCAIDCSKRGAVQPAPAPPIGAQCSAKSEPVAGRRHAPAGRNLSSPNADRRSTLTPTSALRSNRRPNPDGADAADPAEAPTGKSACPPCGAEPCRHVRAIRARAYAPAGCADGTKRRLERFSRSTRSTLSTI
jgi:hypothetical protein